MEIAAQHEIFPWIFLRPSTKVFPSKTQFIVPKRDVIKRQKTQWIKKYVIRNFIKKCPAGWSVMGYASVFDVIDV